MIERLPIMIEYKATPNTIHIRHKKSSWIVTAPKFPYPTVDTVWRAQNIESKYSKEGLSF